MFANSSIQEPNGIRYLTPVNDQFEKRYIALREKEGYLLSIEEVKQLPLATVNKENWALRGQTAKMFREYLAKKDPSLIVLEIGCGNGWFSNYLAQSPNVTQVFGLDINQFELQLACKAFAHDRKLNWIYADIFTAEIAPQSFDVIILNSSVQYFPDLFLIISHLKKLLKPQGEIHVLDSPFYKTIDEQKNATGRSAAYYASLGFPEMTTYYTPHLFSELEKFLTECLYRPSPFNSLAHKLKLTNKTVNPFYWFKIKGDQ